MSQIISGLYNLVRTSSFSDLEPHHVREIKISEYGKRPIHYREESLVLYGPHENEFYEIVAMKPMTAANMDVLSIFRTPLQNTAEDLFIIFKDKLPFLMEQLGNSSSCALVQKVADTVRTKPGWSLLHVVVSLGMKNLLNHPDIIVYLNSQCANTGITPLHIAVESKQMQIIQALIDLDADLSILSFNGESVFHFAASTSKEILQVLSKKPNSAINFANKNNETPLHLACKLDKPDCVHALLRAGADVVSPDGDCTILKSAVEEASSSRCIREIVDMYPDQLHSHDMKNGGTPLHWVKSVPCLEALVELGCQVNASNFNSDTPLHVLVERERLACVVNLLSFGANPNIHGSNGYTPLHIAVKTGNIPIIEALLAFGADFNSVNDNNETPRHIASTNDYTKPRLTSFLTNNSTKDRQGHVIYTLHAVGARRCIQDIKSLQKCKDGCSESGSHDGIPLISSPTLAADCNFYDKLFSISTQNLQNIEELVSNTKKYSKKVSVLCLDGGGIRGLVLIQMLIILQLYLEVPLTHCFDWIAGTSTGGILTLGLAIGKSIHECLGLYFRLKSKVFKGNRPYDAEVLEEFLKKELGGGDLKMSDINEKLKIMVTGVMADRHPAVLHLFRSYKSPSDMLEETGIHVEEQKQSSSNPSSSFTIPLKPCDQPVWLAARATGAAPTYFRASGNVIDGGLISNNPTLDVMTEIHEYNQVLRFLNREDEIREIGCVVSLGTGKSPITPINDIDIFRPDSFWNAAKAMRGMSALAALVVDQATACDGQVVKRARAWCEMIKVPYLRLNPSLSTNVNLDETNDEILVHMLWETMVYMKEQTCALQHLKQLFTSNHDTNIL
ncbi:85/ calcium-independent phospholipase A2 [Nymphon striatum]|nr:85/ calcium-independent phospholipase A2 [Nymphon striatum]